MYALVFLLPAFAFPCSLVGLESRFFLFLSITIYYSLITNLTSDKLLFASFISSFIPEWPAILFFFTAPSSLPKWPTTPFFPVAGSWGLVAFLFWHRLLTSLLSKLLTCSLSLLLNMLDNGTTFSYKFLSWPNACFNTRFYNIVRIFPFLSAWFLAQVLLI